MKKSKDPVSEVILKAANLIQRHGLAKRARRSADGFCVHGALSAAETGDAEGFGDLEVEAAKRIHKHLFPRRPFPGGIAEWNNAPERTKKEVVAVLRRVGGKAE